jgi:hypothetical protein
VCSGVRRGARDDPRRRRCNAATVAESVGGWQQCDFVIRHDYEAYEYIDSDAVSASDEAGELVLESVNGWPQHIVRRP